MTTFQDVIGQELTWQQTKLFKRIYELRWGDNVLATLNWPSAWRSAATLATPEAIWTFQRQGVWRPRIIVLDSTGAEIATFTRKWTGGTLAFANGGAIYTFKREGFWNPERIWMTERDMPVLRIKARYGGARAARVVIEPGGASLPELPLLAGAGWYLLVQMADEAASASAATTAATAATV